MARLELTGVPDGVLSYLRERASASGRDLNSQAIDCLQRGMLQLPKPRIDVEAKLVELQKFRESLGKSAWLTPEFIRAARDEGRV